MKNIKSILSLILIAAMLVSVFVFTGIFVSANNETEEQAEQSAATVAESNEATEESVLAYKSSEAVVLPENAKATYSGSCGDDLIWTLDTSTGILTVSGNGEMENHDNYELFSWNDYRSDINSVVIEEGVTSIGDNAFACTHITSITIPDSVVRIGEFAFYCCGYLADIFIPDSVISIGIRAFDGTGLYNIGTNWENNVLYVGDHLIKAKNSISGSYNIKTGTKCIADGAFSYCSYITNIIIPNSTIKIGERVFEGCNSLESINVDDLNEHYKSINGVLFDRSIETLILFPAANQQNEYIIPDSVITLCDWSFYGCSSLLNVDIPESVLSIGEGAFWQCSSLEKIIIPDSVKV